jgi:hypothetical protein
MISTKTVFMNVDFSIRDNLDLDSNLTKESDPHSQKHISPKNSIDEGRMISIKRVIENASLSVRDNLDPDSMITKESELKLKSTIDPKVQPMKEE